MPRAALGLTCLLAGLAGCLSGPEPLGDLELAWADEFDGAAGALPSAQNWRFDLGTDWGNAQLEYDTDRPENASLDGQGNLLITARQEAYQGQPYTSARLTTRALREQRYGRFEARIKVPVSRGIWPAFWMLGADFPTVGWPASGEIDIMEHFGREPGSVQGALHGPNYSGGNALYRRYDLPAGGRFDTAFHVFAVEWTPDRINWFVDDSLYQSIKRSYPPGRWVFDKPFFLILNLAVGGGPPGAPDGSTTFPQVMTVDYVRVYRYKP